MLFIAIIPAIKVIIEGNQQIINIKLNVFNTIQIIIRQIKLKIDAIVIIAPPIWGLFKQKNDPIKIITNIAIFKIGTTFNNIFVKPFENAPTKIKTIQNK